jgi:hypothetical protein
MGNGAIVRAAGSQSAWDEAVRVVFAKVVVIPHVRRRGGPEQRRLPTVRKYMLIAFVLDRGDVLVVVLVVQIAHVNENVGSFTSHLVENRLVRARKRARCRDNLVRKGARFESFALANIRQSCNEAKTG